MPRLFLAASTLALITFLTGCAAPTKNTSRTFTTVTVDAGHGGRDSGAYRRAGGLEKVATLDVARRLNRKLRESQLQTVMTRSSDVFVSLDERVAIGNRQPSSIFVSIHFNDSRRRAVHGVETYYNSPAARGLAQRIQQKLMTSPRATDRGVRPGNFRVLRNLFYPAVLIECGFLSNRREGREARSDLYRERLADKIAEAIVEHRFGPGIYHAPPQPKPPAEGPGVASPVLFPPEMLGTPAPKPSPPESR